MESTLSYPTLRPMIGSPLSIRHVRAHGDEILRLAASIKQGIVTITVLLILRKLGSYQRQFVPSITSGSKAGDRIAGCYRCSKKRSMRFAPSFRPSHMHITETRLLITNLHFNSISCSGKASKMLKLSSIVSKELGDAFDRRRPIIGEYSFVHTAKLHVTANSRNRNCYHWIDPAYLSE